MFQEIDSSMVYDQNFMRINMLIAAMEKIQAYNRLYRQSSKCKDLGYEYVKIVESVQNDELEKIEKSCALHVIVAIPITYEAYFKKLIQEILSENPAYFLEG